MTTEKRGTNKKALNSVEEFKAFLKGIGTDRGPILNSQGLGQNFLFQLRSCITIDAKSPKMKENLLNMMINILYDDNHLLVVEKPVNIPVQADRTGDKDLLTLLKEDIKVRHNKPGNVFLGLVHRLDRPVGGVMVFAKTSKAASRLSDVIRRQALERKYVAVVRGKLPQNKGTLEHYLVKDSRRNKVFAVDPSNKKAKKAVLDYSVIGQRGEFSLVSIQLHTGRPHQIRVQLSSVGCPLYGDQKYGQHVNKPGEQIALWAASLRFPHPTTKESVYIQSFPPEAYPWNLWSITEL